MRALGGYRMQQGKISMASQEVDRNRRRFLTGATTVLGGAGVAALAVPFFASMGTSARAQAAGAPVEVDVSRIGDGQRLTFEWRGQPVWVVHRTEEMIATLEEIEGRLADPESNQSEQPEYARNRYRAREPEFLVIVGVCTHLGCSPAYRPEQGPADLGSDWLGGFFCACHGSSYDLSGRVFAGQPAPLNMPIPPHSFSEDGDLLVIGEDEETATG